MKIAVCLALILVAIGYITWASNQAEQHVKRGVVVVMPRINHSIHHFNLNDFWGWEYGQIELERVFVAPINSESRTIFANISEIGWNFLDIAIMTFRYGGLWRDEGSIIISQDLAWELFGYLDVVGLPVWIDDKLHTITGVTWHEENFAWILRDYPIENANILYIRHQPYNWIFAETGTVYLLELLGRRVENYTITNINFYLRNMALRRYILILIASSFLIVALISYFLKSAQIFAKIFVLYMAFHSLVLLPMQYGHKQVFFNWSSLASRQYLSGSLVALYDLNFLVSVAFKLGLIVYAILIIFWWNETKNASRK